MATERTSILQLAESVRHNAQVITDILNEQQVPQPSFAVDSPLTLPEGPDKLQDARMSLLTSTFALEQLVTGPQDFIFWQSLVVKHDLFALQALQRFDVFDAVPTQGSISYTDLAAKLPITEKQLRGIMRHALTRNIFAEIQPDHIAHNAISIAPIKKPTLKSWIGHNLEDVLVASSRLGDAIEKYGDVDDVTKTAMSLGHGAEGKDMWGFFAEDDRGGKKEKGWRTARFAQAMENMTGGGHEMVHIHNGFDWASLGNATVVDLGGSTGHVSVSLAQKFPALNFIVKDLPELEDAFRTGLPAELESRVTFEATDFFDPQPSQQADVFFLRHILHDWPDAAAVKILQNIINTKAGLLRDGTRLIVSDSVFPPTGTLPQPLERVITSMDLQMWCALNARERTEKAWAQLFKAADERLEVKASIQPPGSANTIMEVVFRHARNENEI